MKKQLLITILVILLVTCTVALSACTNITPDEEVESTAKVEPVDNVPYRINYLKDVPSTGNCTAQLVLNSNWEEDFTVEIPEKSPDGNIVTHFERKCDFCNGSHLPLILSEKTYQEVIYQPLLVAVERGELGETKEDGRFYVNKIASYYFEKDPKKMKTTEEREQCINDYPITNPNGANIPIRIFSDDVSITEKRMIWEYLSKYTSLSDKIMKAECLYFQDAIRKLDLNDTQKAELMAKYRYCESDHLVGISLPDSLLEVTPTAFLGYEKRMQEENGIYYAGNWVVSTDNDIISATLRDGTVGIVNGAFYNCLNSMTKITIPDSMTSIADYTFSDCKNLTDIIIPNSVTSIGSTAFSRCSSLTSITIPDSVTNIGSAAFSHCSSLTSITIPDSVTNIDSNVFDGCHNLKTITFSGTQDQWLALIGENSVEYSFIKIICSDATIN
ncbi:MAG TPA: hypothetical protein DDW30_08975 [Clostridiales bacterium]|nr:hypothetical protein [Clostridiales bacterium]